MLVECLSGLSFNARRWCVADRKNLNDIQLRKKGLLLKRMVEILDEGVENPGPYKFSPGRKANWGEVYIGDILSALLAVRKTRNNIYDFDTSCGNQDCGAEMEMAINLDKVKHKPISPEGINFLNTGELIEKYIPLSDDLDPEDNENCALVKLRLLNGNAMGVLQQHYKTDPSSSEEMQTLMHIGEITPPGCKEAHRDFRLIKKYVFAQDPSFIDLVDNIVLGLGGGIDTRVTGACKLCSLEQRFTLPFGRQFFFPQKKHKTSFMDQP
jgi:hypothetical protein